MERPSTDDELFAYLDGKLKEVQVRELKTKLEASPALQARLDELRAIHIMLAKNKLETPSSNFTHRVMTNLHRIPLASPLSPKNGLILLCGTMVALGILSFLLSSGFFDTMNHTIALDQLPVKQEIIKESIPFSGKMVVNILMVLNVALALVLFDRTVLRPFFNKRLQGLH